MLCQEKEKLMGKLKKELVDIIEWDQNKIDDLKKERLELKYFESESKVVEIVFNNKIEWFEKQLRANKLYSEKLIEGFIFAYRDIVHDREELDAFASCNSLYEFIRYTMDTMQNWDYLEDEVDTGDFVKSC